MLKWLLQIGVPITLACQFPAAADVTPCENAVVARDLATSSYRQGDFGSATRGLRQAIALCPSEPFYEFMLGNALYRAGELKESARHYEKFLAARPNHLEARMSLGFTWFEIGERKRALDEWRAAATIDPQSGFARAALAVGLYATGDRDNAALNCELAMKLDFRYGKPDALGVDIRWKPAARTTLSEIIRGVDSGGR